MLEYMKWKRSNQHIYRIWRYFSKKNLATFRVNVQEVQDKHCIDFFNLSFNLWLVQVIFCSIQQLQIQFIVLDIFQIQQTEGPTKPAPRGWGGVKVTSAKSREGQMPSAWDLFHVGCTDAQTYIPTWSLSVVVSLHCNSNSGHMSFWLHLLHCSLPAFGCLLTAALYPARRFLIFLWVGKI